jgi:class 3 adenylate cyclase
MKEDTLKAHLLALISLNYPPIKPDEGIKYGEQALELSTKLGWKKGISSSYSSLAANYNAKSDRVKMLDYLFKALKISEEINDMRGIASNVNNIGIVFEGNGNYANALEYFLKGMKLQEEIGNKSGVAIASGNIATIYLHEKNYAKAREYNAKALKITEELGDKEGMPFYLEIMGDIYRAERNYRAAIESYFKAMKCAREIDDLNNVAICLGFVGHYYLDMAEDSVRYKPDSIIPPTKALVLKRAIEYLDSGRSLSQQIGFRDGVFDFSEHLSEAYEAAGNHKEAIATYKRYVALKDSVFTIENTEKITHLETQREIELKDKQIEIDKLAVAKKRNERGFYIAGMVALLGIVVYVGRSNKLLGREKKKSEDLLLNILPSEVADELKEKGVADARHFDDVTVLFTDFVNFTEAGERMTPKQLVDELHNCFKAFDGILSKYNIEKIKTVGDAYLAVSGLPASNVNHATDIVNAAREIRNFMLQRKQQMGDRTFEMRIGIHSGSVVAGIVGVKKFAYDIWGDTVNTAARMEQHGAAGKVNISQTTYELVKDKFSCEYRGEVEAKGKGGMKMYFVA